MTAIIPFSQLSRSQARLAVELLCAHRPRSERDPQIEKFLQAVDRGELDPASIFTVWWKELVVAVQVVERIPGNAAVLWAIRSRPGDRREQFEDELLQEVFQHLRLQGVKLAQCFLAEEERDAANALARNGCNRLTSILHMHNGLSTITFEKVSTITVHPFVETRQEVFTDVLMRSFHETVDCPELNGLRTAEEVFAGHLASAPDQSRWWLIRDQGVEVGVLILGDAPQTGMWDLAYLGVVPEARRHGIGRAVLAFAMRQAINAGMAGITLMVDRRNLPAIELYEGAGFQTVASRDVYLWISET